MDTTKAVTKPRIKDLALIAGVSTKTVQTSIDLLREMEIRLNNRIVNLEEYHKTHNERTTELLEEELKKIRDGER